MSSEKPTPERIVVDFPKTEIADEKTRRSVLRLALPLVLLPHVAQEFWLHSLLQRRQYRGRPPLGDHRLPSLLDSLVAHHSKRRGTAVTRPSAPRSTSASVTTKPNSFRSTKTLSGPTSATPSAYCTSLAGRNSTRSYIPKRSTAATGDRQGPDQVLKMRT
jgi:hypothetical protein